MERGLTMVFITHNLAVVRSIAQNVIVLQTGRIVEAGSVEAVLSAPKHPHTPQLLQGPPPLDPAQQAAPRAAPGATPPPASPTTPRSASPGEARCSAARASRARQ